MAATAAGYSPDLPDPVIHRILTFLTPIEAAETTLLSKSWFQAWLTRPTIDLDDSHFPGDDSSDTKIDGLTSFATNTFQRYEESNLTIDAFILSLKSKGRYFEVSNLAKNWTSKALKLGATDFTFRFRHPNFNNDGNVGIKSLTLSCMDIPTYNLFSMISSCPLIENLSLSDVWSGYDYSEEYGLSRVSFLHLTSLTMVRVTHHFQKMFLDYLSSMFPNLKDLTLNLSIPEDYHYLKNELEIPVISSDSLENLYLRVEGRPGAGVKIHVPRIRKFTFKGSVIIPKFTFRSKSRDQLESHVSIINNGKLSTIWFYKLSEFLTSMAGSKICLRLRLHLHARCTFDYRAGDIKCSKVVCEVEDLTMDMRGLPTESLYAVLDVLFRICRPKMITQHVDTRNDNVILRRVLEQGMKEKGSLRLPCQFMYGLRDLEGINEVGMLRPFDSVVGSTSDDHQKRFRLQLKWKHTTCHP